MSATDSVTGREPTGTHANTRVAKDDWTLAALEVIAESGVAGLRVEALARQLGITKGSFYWHFRDRTDLIAAALDLWYRLGTLEIIEQLDRIDDPEERLSALFSKSFGDLVGGPIDALLLGQVNDPVIGPAVVRTTTARLDFLTRTYRALGLPKQRAAARARLVYAAYIGTGHLGRVPGQAPATTRDASAFTRELDVLLRA